MGLGVLIKNYDVIINKNIGILKGKDKLIFIKVGLSGSINGFNDKYKKIANLLLEKFGYNVVISSNKINNEFNFSNELELASKYLSNYDEIFFIGISDGARKGIKEIAKNKLVNKALLINMPIMINWLKIKEAIIHFQGDKLKFVYSQFDPSIKYINLIKNIDNNKINLNIINNEVHNLTFDSLRDILELFIKQSINLMSF